MVTLSVSHISSSKFLIYINLKSEIKIILDTSEPCILYSSYRGGTLLLCAQQMCSPVFNFFFFYSDGSYVLPAGFLTPALQGDGTNSLRCYRPYSYKWRSFYNSLVEVQISLPSLDTIQ